MLKVKSINRKQKTLAAFEFKKKIVLKSVETEVKLPTAAIDVLYPCDNCERKFKSSQGLSFYVETMHQNVICSSFLSSHKKSKPVVIKS